MTEFAWWQKGVVYQIYPRSFQDTTGNGVGDLQGIINHLDYLNDGTPNSLGIDAIWISPFYPSPMVDFGYDVSDYVDIHPLFGDLETFDNLVEEAHKRDIKLIIDFVPNHTSDEHEWFKESRSSRENPKADWYIWRDAKPDGSRPNNWGSMFGGPAWTWDETRQQYYFHQFHPRQPDLNWRNPEVREAMHDVLRFWMRRGVDGFRMDVVYIIWKHPDMPDQPLKPGVAGRGEDDLYNRQQQIYAYNYEGIHERMREIRKVLDEYEAVGIAELWLPMEERIKYYGENQPDEFHMPFNFSLIAEDDFIVQTPWEAERICQLVDKYEAAKPEHGWSNWVLGNHDVPRLASRVGEEQTRNAAMLLLTLPGTPTIYMGDEIGMVNGVVPLEQMQDPQGHILGPEYSRDVSRTPMQWNSSDNAGFSKDAPWLPVNADYAQRNISKQMLNPNSMLSFYRQLIWLRKDSMALSVGEYESLSASKGVYIYQRSYGDEVKVIVLNFTDETRSIDIEQRSEVVLNTGLDRTGEKITEGLELRPNEGVVLDIS